MRLTPEEHAEWHGPTHACIFFIAAHIQCSSVYNIAGWMFVKKTFEFK